MQCHLLSRPDSLHHQEAHRLALHLLVCSSRPLAWVVHPVCHLTRADDRYGLLL